MIISLLYILINFESQKKFNDCRNPKTNRKLKFDFFIEKYNLLIEFDGKQHYTSVAYMNTEDIQYRDRIKDEYAKDNNIKLLRIIYNDINRINEILENEFVKKL